jgi:hypothetical protein
MTLTVALALIPVCAAAVALLFGLAAARADRALLSSLSAQARAPRGDRPIRERPLQVVK